MELPSVRTAAQRRPHRHQQPSAAPRRLRRYAPNVEVVPIRGNVETRLRKAEGDEADGAVLAAAGPSPAWAWTTG